MTENVSNNNLIKDEIRNRLTEYVCQISQPSPKNGKDMYICPLCGSGTGKHKTGALHITGEKWKCHACDRGGDIFTLYALKNNLDSRSDFPEIIKGLSDALGLDHPTETTKRTASKKTEPRENKEVRDHPDRAREIEQFSKQMIGSPAQEYLRQRMISDETIEHFKLGYNPENDRVVIPYPNTDFRTERRLRENQGKKYLYPSGETVPLFVINEAKTGLFFITEGQIDALSMYQAGARNVIALGGGLSENKKKIIKSMNITGGIIIADRDSEEQRDGLTAGEKIAREVESLLSEDKICSVIIYPPIGCKDSNDILRKDQNELTNLLNQGNEQLSRVIRKRAEDYSEKYSAKSNIKNFLEYIEREQRTGSHYPTGYQELDQVLDGGLYAGLYALGGGTGTGKTTFTLNLAEHIARSGNNVLLIELEMSKEELFSKIISNLSVRTCQRLGMSDKHSLTTREVLRGGKYNETDEDRLIREETFRDFAENVAPYIYIYESIGNCTVEDVRNEIEEHIRNTGNKPVVMIDYLQIMSNSDEYIRWNDKAKTDSNVLGLKQISRDYSLPVLIVSSLNRESYKDITQEVNLTSFKESGAIEYSCDVVLGLQLSVVTDINSSEDKEERKRAEARLKDEIKAIPKSLDVKVIKNRHGELGGIVRFSFDQRQNKFSEIMRVRKTQAQTQAERKKKYTSFADENER